MNCSSQQRRVTESLGQWDPRFNYLVLTNRPLNFKQTSKDIGCNLWPDSQPIRASRFSRGTVKILTMDGYAKNLYNISSGYGGRNFTEAKQTALFSNESQLSVSKSKILTGLLCWVRNLKGAILGIWVQYSGLALHRTLITRTALVVFSPSLTWK